jgi:hypothetical protein
MWADSSTGAHVCRHSSWTLFSFCADSVTFSSWPRDSPPRPLAFRTRSTAAHERNTASVVLFCSFAFERTATVTRRTQERQAGARSAASTCRGWDPLCAERAPPALAAMLRTEKQRQRERECASAAAALSPLASSQSRASTRAKVHVGARVSIARAKVSSSGTVCSECDCWWMLQTGLGRGWGEVGRSQVPGEVIPGGFVVRRQFDFGHGVSVHDE